MDDGALVVASFSGKGDAELTVVDSIGLTSTGTCATDAKDCVEGIDTLD